MANMQFNVAKGATVEKFRDGGANGLVLLLEAMEADAVLADYDNLQALLAAPGNQEISGGSYSRQTGISGSITINDTTDEVDISIPDQTFLGVVGSSVVGFVIAYEETASDAGRIPLAKFDLFLVPDGSDILVRTP